MFLQENTDENIYMYIYICAKIYKSIIERLKKYNL